MSDTYTVRERLAPRYLNKRDAAFFCSVSQRVLDYARQQGLLTAHKLGRKVVFAVSDLVTWMETYRVEGGGNGE